MYILCKSYNDIFYVGQVVLIGDSVGAIMAFDAVCSSSSVGGSSCSTANCGADGGFGQQQQQQQQQQKRQQRASSSEGSLNAGEGRQQLDEGNREHLSLVPFP